MEIKEIQDKKIWEDFLLIQENKTFLMSWNWGEFQEKMGNKFWRFGIYDKNELIVLALVIKVVAKRGVFLLIPHGPLGKKEAFGFLFDELKKLARQERASFIRIVPLLERNEDNQKLLNNLGFKKSPIHASAYESTLKLNLSLTEEGLLMNMRKTTRYLIRQVLKNPDLEIAKSDKAGDVGIYYNLSQKVSKHQKFVPFSIDFVKNEFEVFLKENQALLFFGKIKGEIVSSALVVFWSGTAFYHHAALDPKYHKLPIAYLLQWEIIKEAKKRGCNMYDFWGFVDPKEYPDHPWAGPTLFKMGFGGKPFLYIETQDLPFSKKYYLTWLFENLRKSKRGL